MASRCPTPPTQYLLGTTAAQLLLRISERQIRGVPAARAANDSPCSQRLHNKPRMQRMRRLDRHRPVPASKDAYFFEDGLLIVRSRCRQHEGSFRMFYLCELNEVSFFPHLGCATTMPANFLGSRSLKPSPLAPMLFMYGATAGATELTRRSGEFSRNCQLRPVHERALLPPAAGRPQ